MHDVHQREEVAAGGPRRLARAALVAVLAVPASAASADHDMAMHDHQHVDAHEVAVGLAVEAASYDTEFYVGSYQGVTPSLTWMYGRFGASTAITLYHLTQNGLSRYGLGDTMLGGHAVVLERDAMRAGLAIHVMLPTGSSLDNLGMGHTMAMPSLWASWRVSPWTVAASAGYSRALADLGGHNHGLAPLVDPMNMQELAFRAAADVDLGHGMQLGGRAQGGVPIGTGSTHVFGGGRFAWGTPRVSTGLELQVGVAGDPFTVRGVLDTALRF